MGNLTARTAQVAGSGTRAYTVGYQSARPHAATHVNGEQRYWYDGNGNMTQRVEGVGSQRLTYTQGWDVENRLIAITNTASGQVTTYSYNASGQRVKRVDAGGTLVTLGAHFEQLRVGTAVTHTSYYYFGDQRVALRQTNVGTGVSTVYWLHGDHLGSASLATYANGTAVPNSVTRYKPFGEIRYPSSGSSSLPTDRTFTGQRSEKASFAGSLMDYGARFYSPLLGRFLSADSLVPQPGDPQSLNRYSYALGNPLKYTDPTGHFIAPPNCLFCDQDIADVSSWSDFARGVADLACALSIGCYVDRERNVIRGPTVADWVELGFQNSLPAVGSVGVVVQGVKKIGGNAAQAAIRSTYRQALEMGSNAIAKRAGSGAGKRATLELVDKGVFQEHHLLTVRHGTKWTDQFRQVAQRYGLTQFSKSYFTIAEP